MAINPTTMKNDASAAASGLSSKAHGFVDDAVDKLTPAVERATDRVAGKAHQAIDSMAESAEPALEWADSKARRATELADVVGSFARERPLATVGIALLAGYLIGRMR